MQPYDSVLFERICRCLALDGSWFPWNPSISFLYLGVEWGRSRRSVEMSLIRRLNWQWAVHWNHDSSAVLSVYSITPHILLVTVSVVLLLVLILFLLCYLTTPSFWCTSLSPSQLGHCYLCEVSAALLPLPSQVLMWSRVCSGDLQPKGRSEKGR